MRENYSGGTNVMRSKGRRYRGRGRVGDNSKGYGFGDQR